MDNTKAVLLVDLLEDMLNKEMFKGLKWHDKENKIVIQTWSKPSKGEAIEETNEVLKYIRDKKYPGKTLSYVRKNFRNCLTTMKKAFEDLTDKNEQKDVKIYRIIKDGRCNNATCLGYSTTTSEQPQTIAHEGGGAFNQDIVWTQQGTEHILSTIPRPILNQTFSSSSQEFLSSSASSCAPVIPTPVGSENSQVYGALPLSVIEMVENNSFRSRSPVRESEDQPKTTISAWGMFKNVGISVENSHGLRQTPSTENAGFCHQTAIKEPYSTEVSQARGSSAQITCIMTELNDVNSAQQHPPGVGSAGSIGLALYDNCDNLAIAPVVSPEIHVPPATEPSHLVRLEVFYRNHQVVVEEINTDIFTVYYGKSCYTQPGEHELGERIKLPQLPKDKFQKYSSKQLESLQKAIDGCKKGVTIIKEKNDFYVIRRCKSSVIAKVFNKADCKYLERDRKTSIMNVLDVRTPSFNDDTAGIFTSQPTTFKFRLTIGINRPVDDNCHGAVDIDITYFENKSETDSILLEPDQVSSNSFDKIIDSLDKMSIELPSGSARDPSTDANN